MGWDKHSDTPLTAPPATVTATAPPQLATVPQQTVTRAPDTRDEPNVRVPATVTAPVIPPGPAPKLDWVAPYLEELSINGGIKGKAATHAGTNRQRVMEHRERDPEFRALENHAMERSRETAEDEARRRAIEGMENIYTTKDGATRVVRTYSDTILLRLLERQETGSWRQKQQIEHSGGMTFKTKAERQAALEKARAVRDNRPQAPVTATNGRS
jgi:hypothetical protein